MATKVVKKELMNDEIKEFGEDAASTINELLGLYGLEDENKTVKFHRSNYKRIANISQKLMESKRRCSKASDSESTRMLKINDYSSISSDKDSSSRENSKSPIVLKNSSNEKQEINNCSWCHQSISSESNETIGSGAGALFCSENCFIFWRRASFKRAKTCDFCKNVRNAVSYVDFNDGTTQLQFCSDKCLNQYKMQIFCHETQTHLELNPHLKEKAKSDTNESLITPDLWLKNCRTRSPTPEQFSKSPSPMTIAEEKMVLPKIIVTQQPLPSSSTKITSTVANLTHNDNNAVDCGSSINKKQPMINVLPSSKLLSRNMLLHKNLRKRRVSARLAMSSKGNQNANGNNSGNERIMNTNFPADLRAKIHSQSQTSNKPMQQKQTTTTSNFNRPPIQQFMQRPPINLFKFRLPFAMPTAQQQHQHHHRMPIPLQQLPPPPPPLEDPNTIPVNPLVPPPVSVVFVPYPIPLPIILPIPLPLTAFMRAYQRKESELSSNENDNESQERIPLEKKKNESESEEPLDLSSIEQGGEKNSPSHDADVDEDNDDYDDIQNENVPKFEMNTTHMSSSSNNNNNNNNNANKNQSNEYTCESNRPLRKRKIISTPENDESF
ncbi:hypothetical protein PVAND_011529 [Polypedilum vanderplanki]|uniref:TRASH domain-containing protein n=1 Tax=Polypedilum vanderplanki TaxID=319348 RepID=A0A9J6CJL4_POLVA|nr:hypothetical protein PVAND_011529 [Polypedilum vanderplanki]